MAAAFEDIFTFLESLDFFHGEMVKVFNRTTMALVYCYFLKGCFLKTSFAVLVHSLVVVWVQILLLVDHNGGVFFTFFIFICVHP
jgi:hypothetical protein